MASTQPFKVRMPSVKEHIYNDSDVLENILYIVIVNLLFFFFTFCI